MNLPGREGEAPAEPHARVQGVLKVTAQLELHRFAFPTAQISQLDLLAGRG